MFDRFLNADMDASQILAQIKRTDMASLIKPLLEQSRSRDRLLAPEQLRAVMAATVNCQAASLILFANEYGNVEARFPLRAKPLDWLYSLPGNVILFALSGYPYDVTRHALDENGLSLGEPLIVDAQTPRLFNGVDELYRLDDSRGADSCFLAINFPDASRDIAVYCKTTLKKISWLPSHQGVQRFLVGLDAMRAVNDPNISKVAFELIQHPHPEIKRAAYKVLQDYDPVTAAQVLPEINMYHDSRLNTMAGHGAKGES